MESNLIGRHVVVRTYSAGVHVGTLSCKDGNEVVLTNSRRLWYWAGAFTLSAVAMRGVGKGSKVATAVPEIVLTEAIEIIPTTPEAQESIASQPEYTP